MGIEEEGCSDGLVDGGLLGWEGSEKGRNGEREWEDGGVGNR